MDNNEKLPKISNHGISGAHVTITDGSPFAGGGAGGLGNIENFEKSDLTKMTIVQLGRTPGKSVPLHEITHIDINGQKTFMDHRWLYGEVFGGTPFFSIELQDACLPSPMAARRIYSDEDGTRHDRPLDPLLVAPIKKKDDLVFSPASLRTTARLIDELLQDPISTGYVRYLDTFFEEKDKHAQLVASEDKSFNCPSPSTLRTMARRLRNFNSLPEPTEDEGGFFTLWTGGRRPRVFSEAGYDPTAIMPLSFEFSKKGYGESDLTSLNRPISEPLPKSDKLRRYLTERPTINRRAIGAEVEPGSGMEVMAEYILRNFKYQRNVLIHYLNKAGFALDYICEVSQLTEEVVKAVLAEPSATVGVKI